jgi:uncharacterized membrane protein
MTYTKRILSFLTLLFLVSTNRVFALEQERISTFDSQIVINKDASLTVTESIKAYANGTEIKRGIYRDFPTNYTDVKGLNYKTTFEVLEVLKDGVKEDYHTEGLSNGTRLYIGNSNVFLTPGFYLYTIKYQTKRQLGFFSDHDELYFNVTGNGWIFPIEKATATVQLPSGLNTDQISVVGYTGVEGSKDTNFTSKVYSADGNTYAFFETTSQVQPKQGLTVAVGWPKGFVNEPTQSEKTSTLISSNLSYTIGAVLFLITLIYYLVVWSKHGRDPEGAGTVVPQFDTIEGISPAGTRYIHKMGFDNKTLTVSLISMAIKGYLKIDEGKKEFSIDLVGDNESKLSEEESVLAQKFFSGDVKTFTFKQTYAVKISSAIKLFKKNLEKTYSKKYFSNNRKFLIIPLMLNLLLLVFLSVSTFGALSLAIFFATACLNVVGIGVMKARTVLGRKVEDQILGLKEYLMAVEKPRYASTINLETPDSLKIYEKYLPYAIALDVEPIWTGRFKEQIDASLVKDADGTYNTYWFHGRSFYSNGVFSKSFSSAFTSAIASSSTPPGSSSGFSGGSSGGGGGGGGGGGW